MPARPSPDSRVPSGRGSLTHSSVMLSKLIERTQRHIAEMRRVDERIAAFQTLREEIAGEVRALKAQLKIPPKSTAAPTAPTFSSRPLHAASTLPWVTLSDPLLARLKRA